MPELDTSPVPRHIFDKVIEQINKVNAAQSHEIKRLSKVVQALNRQVQLLDAETGGYTRPQTVSGGDPVDAIDTSILGE